MTTDKQMGGKGYKLAVWNSSKPVSGRISAGDNPITGHNWCYDQNGRLS